LLPLHKNSNKKRYKKLYKSLILRLYWRRP